MTCAAVEVVGRESDEEAEETVLDARADRADGRGVDETDPPVGLEHHVARVDVAVEDTRAEDVEAVQVEELQHALVGQGAALEQLVEGRSRDELRDQHVFPGELLVQAVEAQPLEVVASGVLVPDAAQDLLPRDLVAQVQLVQRVVLDVIEDSHGVEDLAQLRVDPDRRPQQAAQGSDVRQEGLLEVPLDHLHDHGTAVGETRAVDLTHGGGRERGPIQVAYVFVPTWRHGAREQRVDALRRQRQVVPVELRQVTTHALVEEVDAQGEVLGDLDRQQTLALDALDVRQTAAVDRPHQVEEAQQVHIPTRIPSRFMISSAEMRPDS